MFLFLSIVFFYIAYGAINEYKKEFVQNKEMIPKMGTYVYLIIGLLCYILPVIGYVKLWKIAWYWSILLNFFICNLLSGLMYSFYITLFGVKSKPQLSLRYGGYVRKNLFIMDAFISFGIGILLLIIDLL